MGHPVQRKSDILTAYLEKDPAALEVKYSFHDLGSVEDAARIAVAPGADPLAVCVHLHFVVRFGIVVDSLVI